MNKFPENIRFKYEWRKYQQRVLSELDGHLDDNHLHIIAPPGSGKTVLGLEVAVRLDKPTLILAPTIAIRNQWIERFSELFLQQVKIPDWISTNVKQPEFLTVITYQSLHAAFVGSVEGTEEAIDSKNEDLGNDLPLEATAKEVIQKLKQNKIGTIVIDEAHHLKKEWWKSLSLVKNSLQPTIVGLTATPPYDVSYLEWQRYLQLNGPVDAEISVPELVIAGDLCPHQDYIFLSTPTSEETNEINEQKERIKKVFSELKSDNNLISELKKIDFYQFPNLNLEWIYDNVETYSSVLIYLNAVGEAIPEENLKVISNKEILIPELNYKWMEVLLTFYLHEHQNKAELNNSHKEKLTNLLKRNGLLEKRKINFGSNLKANKLLGTSLSKLESIQKIVEIEQHNLANDLRMVILSDFIRKEFIVKETENNLPLNTIGVLPIFEKLRRAKNDGLKLGVLTGSVVIVPSSSKEILQSEAKRMGLDEVNLNVLSYDSEYVSLSLNDKIRSDIVRIITKVFERGLIHVLIGTKSLLGEGWDAPAINSLILASFVGSYVLSNQMRGRAIRSDKRVENKTANIWHLCCIDMDDAEGGEDIQLLKRKFKAFVGLSFGKEPTIENGVGRINLPGSIRLRTQIDEFNAEMIETACNRKDLSARWEKALSRGVSLVEEIKVPFEGERKYHEVTSLYYKKTIAYLIATLSSGIAAFIEMINNFYMRMGRNIKSTDDLLRFLSIIAVFGVIIFGRQLFFTARLYFKYRDISDDLNQIGEATLSSLVKIGLIKTDISKLFVRTSLDEYGTVFCHLDGGTTYEKSTFIQVLKEILSPPKNPRYVIIRKSLFLNIFSQSDFHPVPEVLGRNKDSAEYFEKQWSRNVGRCELVYTRSLRGRQILLKARVNSLASEFEDKTDAISIWK